MTDKLEKQDIKRFSVTFSLDRGSYFRRACSSCGLHFKTQANAADLASMLQPTFRQAETAVGDARPPEGEVDAEKSPELLWCPYCGIEAKASDMLTDEFADYLKRLMYRELVLPQVRKAFSAFTGSSRRSGSGGLFSIQVTMDYKDSGLPPRPIDGPELPDMQRVEMLCCNHRVKILDGWRDTIWCPYCGTRGVLQ